MCFMSVVFTDMTSVNDRKKYIRSIDSDIESRSANSSNADDATGRLDKSAARSDLAKYRIPKKQQSHKDEKNDSMTMSDDLKRKRVNFSSDTDSPQLVSCTAADKPAGTSVVDRTNISNHTPFLQTTVKRPCTAPGVRSSQRNTFHNTPGSNRSLNAGGQSSSNSVPNHLQYEKKKVNFGPDTLLKTDALKPNSSTATDKPTGTSVADVANVGDHCPVRLTYYKCPCTSAGVQSSERNTFCSTPGSNSSLIAGTQPSSKGLTGVPGPFQSSVLYSHSHRNASKEQRQSRTVVSDTKAAAVEESEPQEAKKKLPEELVRAGWKLCWSKQRCRWYVFNVRTGTSSWDVPKGC